MGEGVGLQMLAMGLTGLGLAAVSAWLAIKGEDGTGWAIVAVLVLLGMCTRA